MATTTRTSADREVEYPTSDGRPMAETQLHAQDLMDLILTLRDRYADDPDVYVWGNLMLYYEEGNRRKHVSPDVFLIRGVPKLPPRDSYLIWKEGKAPDVVIEITSKTTRSEDQKKKWTLYQDVLKVPEYFLFDPREEYLKPSMQGYQLRRRRYVPIEMVLGRLPSVGLGLHLERNGTELRLYDPTKDRRLLTPAERVVGSEATRDLAEAARLRAEAAQLNAETRALIAEAEIQRLRRELEGLKPNPPDPSS
jgi:Uma2 family endonuclease